MMKFSIEMPQVSGCQVTQCVYNMKNNCHARAITVGDGVSANCDTFFESTSHNRRKEMAGVGACKVSGCTYNNDYECQAERISIGAEKNQASCITFSPR